MEGCTENTEGRQTEDVVIGVNDDGIILTNEGHKTKSYGISIDSTLIRSVPVNEQASALRDLNLNVFNQEEFEEGVLKQVDEAIAIQETEEVVRGWEKELKAVDEDVRTVESELKKIDRILCKPCASGYEGWRRAQAVRKQKDNKLRQLKKLEAKQKSLHYKLGIGKEEELESEGSGHFPQHDHKEKAPQLISEDQSEKDLLIKRGEMTPFGGIVQEIKGKTELLKESSVSSFAFTCNRIDQRTERHNLQEAMTRERSQDKLGQEQGVKETLARPSASKPRNCYDYDDNDDYVPEEDELKHSWYEDEDEAHEEKGLLQKSKGRKPSLNVSYTEADSDRPNTGRKKARRAGRKDAAKPVDDGNEKMYRKRIRELRIKELLKQRVEYQANTTDEEDLPDMEFDKGLKIPGKIWHKLYKYQQTGVQWLWELHCQQAGGIVGDEMGLGKTIQMIVFLAGLKYSKISAKKSRHGGLGPVLIVCPVTVLHQWVQEFHKWWPEFRVAVLHETGTYQGFKQELIRKICSQNGVLVTSYSGVRQHQDHLLADRFDYVILDEGHKIRNPDAEITLACKQFRTSHRIILSGSPMQNNLRELWSLFDFVFPGKLGTLPVFMTEFSVPITMGGYSNATKVQVETAYKCACVLRDTINPYLLRRLKKDVKMSLELPSKNEQVLFCRLTDEQRELYQQYLDSREVQAILAGNYKVFPGLIMLRKICNHPDLTSVAGSLVKAKQDCLNLELEGRCEEQEPDPDEGYGDWRRSGKMIVVEALLKMWHQQGHRVLVFSQTRQMLNILETFVSSKGYTYFRMDGSTPVASRQSLINNFNDDDSVSLFLLTTRVGGLGVNLVGADRIIIYDPDWNPSTDTQARERAWRIGQSKPVTIYRLLTTGSIEEKIYHRQIFKQFLTNRVLKDPKQRRFFKSNDLFELFTLDSCDKRYGTETSAIFAGSNCEVKVPGSHKRKTKEARNWEVKEKGHNVKEVGARPGEKPSEKQSRDDGGGFCIDWRDVEETRNLAKKLDEREKNNEQHEETVGEKSDGKESDGVEILCRQAEMESSSGDVTMRIKDSSNVEISTALIHKNQTCILSKIDKKTNSECLRKENSIASECTVAKGNSIAAVSKQTYSSKSHVDAPASRSAVVEAAQSARLTSPKQRKKKISSLSDEELKKRLRLKEKKKKRRRAKLDGQRIENLDYHEIFNPQSTSQSSAAELDKNKRHNANQDEFILKQLFKKTGVHSALKHDVIMESSNPDLALVESEANRVAQNAVKALKRSRQRCLGASSGVPTWTGASGSSGISAPPPKRPRFGQKSSLKKSSSSTEELKKVTSLAEPKPHFSGGLMGMSSTTEESLEPLHSSQLLAKMRARNNLLASEETGTQVLGDERDDLLVQIRNFIALHCGVIGQATTEEILNEFGSRLPKSDSTVFRSMLRQICTFTRDSTTGQGIWKLNPEFR